MHEQQAVAQTSYVNTNRSHSGGALGHPTIAPEERDNVSNQIVIPRPAVDLAAVAFPRSRRLGREVGGGRGQSIAGCGGELGE